MTTITATTKQIITVVRLIKPSIKVIIKDVNATRTEAAAKELGISPLPLNFS